MPRSGKVAQVRLNVRVELGGVASDVRRETGDFVESYCIGLASDLGIPIAPRVTVVDSDEPAGYRLFIEGRSCRTTWSAGVSGESPFDPARLARDVFANRRLLLTEAVHARVQRDLESGGVTSRLDSPALLQLSSTLVQDAVSLSRIPDVAHDVQASDGDTVAWTMAEAARSAATACGAIVPEVHADLGARAGAGVTEAMTALEQRFGVLLPQPGLQIAGSWWGVRLNDARVPIVYGQGVDTPEDRAHHLSMETASELRRLAHLLISLPSVELSLAALASSAENLCTAAMLRLPRQAVVEVVRLLVAEDVSVSDFRLILEAMLRLRGRSTADDSRKIVLPAHWGSLAFSGERSRRDSLFTHEYAAAVRVALGRYLAHEIAPWNGTLLVHLLDQSLEERLAGAQVDTLEESERESLVDAIGRAATSFRRADQRTILLTGASARRTVRALIEVEHPDVCVVAYTELSPESNIQPLSRITLS